MNKKSKTTSSAKKDLKTKLSEKLHVALAEFKEAIHEKKLQKLVKKATKVLADGLHNKPAVKPVSKKPKAVVTKVKQVKVAVKKVAKKAAPKKAAKKE